MMMRCGDCEGMGRKLVVTKVGVKEDGLFGFKVDGRCLFKVEASKSLLRWKKRDRQ